MYKGKKVCMTSLEDYEGETYTSGVKKVFEAFGFPKEEQPKRK